MSESEEKSVFVKHQEDDYENPPMLMHPQVPQCFDPLLIQKNYINVIPKLLEKPIDRKKHKGTNIPKFLLKVFFNNLPEFPDKQHLDRLLNFIRRPEKSKTRFHLVELFGTGSSERENREN